MAYVPGYEHDLFISYAIVDDGTASGVKTGWVTAFVSSLEVELTKHIGRAGRLDPWWDRTDLTRNQPLDEQIQTAIGSTACLIVILTPGFLESPWCPQELDAFRRAVQNHPRGNSRIFVVDQGRLSDQVRIQMFPNYQRFEFFYLDQLRKPRLLGFPQPNPSEPAYYNAINDLAESIKKELDAIKTATGHLPPSEIKPFPSTHPPADQVTRSRTVYLAETSDDLTNERRQVLKFLEDNQFKVLCSGRGATTRAEWQTAVSSELEDADCFVQLIGQFAGRELDDDPTGLVLLQNEVVSSFKQLDKKTLLWRSPELLQKAIDNPELRNLATKAGVIECPIEAFKSEIKRFLTPPPPAREKETVRTDTGFALPSVFINAGVEDVGQAEQLSQILADLNCLCLTPLVEGLPETIREDLEANLIECDGLIMLYGGISPDWVRSQFRNLPRVLPKRMKQDPPRPLKAIAICKGNPPERPNPGVSFPGLKTIELNSAAGKQELAQWVNSLSIGGAV